MGNIQPVLYLQTDSRWKGKAWNGMTIGTAGCGPTCAAMLITTLTGKEVTPEETYLWAGANGHLVKGAGTNYTSYFQKQFAEYGLSCEMLSWNNSYGDANHANHRKMVEEIKKGNYIIALMNKGLWTSNGHFVVVWDVTDTTVEINDPASTKSARIHGDKTTFFSQAKYYWIVDGSKLNGGENDMSKYTAVIPLKNIKKISIEFGNGRTLAQVKAATGCDYIMNGGFYNSSNKPVGHFKKDGVIYVQDSYGAWAYGWDTGPDIEMGSVPSWQKKANYIAGVDLVNLWDGKKAQLYYRAEVGGTRGRTAIGLAGKNLVLYCTGDGTSDAKTPELLRDDLVDHYGVDTAIMLDGGGSSQCDFNGERIKSDRKVNNYICVWADHEAASKAPESASGGSWTHTVHTGGSTLNIRTGPGSAYTKSGFYQDGTAVTVTEQKNGWGHTDKGWVSMTYLKEIVQAPAAQIPEPVVSDPVEIWAASIGLTIPDGSVTGHQVAEMLYRYDSKKIK